MISVEKELVETLVPICDITVQFFEDRALFLAFPDATIYKGQRVSVEFMAANWQKFILNNIPTAIVSNNKIICIGHISHYDASLKGTHVALDGICAYKNPRVPFDAKFMSTRESGNLIEIFDNLLREDYRTFIAENSITKAEILNPDLYTAIGESYSQWLEDNRLIEEDPDDAELDRMYNPFKYEYEDDCCDSYYYDDCTYTYCPDCGSEL